MTIDIIHQLQELIKKEIPEVKKINRKEIGFRIEENIVVGLSLHDCNLDELPELIVELSSLRTLYLSKNNLASLPESFGELSSLEELELASNKLKCLPESFGNLRNLKILTIPGNDLEELPESFGSLSSLEILWLTFNKLKRLPESFSNLSSLIRLLLLNNNLTNLPASIGDLSSLQILDISMNSLKQIPESIKKLTSLQSLNISGNRLEKLPESIGNIVSLQDLILSVNTLRNLPESLNKLSALQTLHLSNNKLKRLPESIDKLFSLRMLNLGKNQLESLPESIGNLDALEILQLSNNLLKKLPDSISKLKSLTNLDLSVNLLDELPVSMGRFASLKYLILTQNNLKNIPTSVKDLTSLKYLNLSANQLEVIPNTINSLVNLEYLSLDHNNIKKLENLEALTNLKRLDIHHNKLSDYEEEISRKSIGEILKYCEDLKNNPDKESDDKNKEVTDYEEYIRTRLDPDNQEDFIEGMDEEILNLGTWQGNLNLNKIQSTWFKEKTIDPIRLNDKIKSEKKVNVYMVQLHKIDIAYCFEPIESNVQQFQYFLESIYKKSDLGILEYDTCRESIKNKISEILNLIFRDDFENKLIVFPENSLPDDYIDEIRNKIEKHLKDHEGNNVVFIGGIEHVFKDKKQQVDMDFFYNQLKNRDVSNFSNSIPKFTIPIEKKGKTIQYNNLESMKKSTEHFSPHYQKSSAYINRAVIIDNHEEPKYQIKQTPVVIKDKYNVELREGIKCSPFPIINLYDTTFGRIAIFICKDFLRLYDAIREWAVNNEVDFVVIPSLSTKILPFYLKALGIFNQKMDDKLKIIYTNVGEFGASELFSVKRKEKIELSFRRNERDNVGEVIVTRECDL